MLRILDVATLIMCKSPSECQDDRTEDLSIDETENQSGSDYEDDIIIRAKWIMDGSKTLDEAIEKVLEFAEYLRGLKENGWKLRQAIDDDYGYLTQ